MATREQDVRSSAQAWENNIVRVYSIHYSASSFWWLWLHPGVEVGFASVAWGVAMNSSFARLVAVLVMATLGFLALPDRSLAQSSDEVLRRLEAKIDTMSKEINTLSKENATLRGRVGNIESSRQVATTANTST